MDPTSGFVDVRLLATFPRVRAVCNDDVGASLSRPRVPPHVPPRGPSMCLYVASSLRTARPRSPCLLASTI